MSNRNNRIFYATQAVKLVPTNDTGALKLETPYYPRGLQSVGVSTNFTLEQVFQLGQIELYENIEDVPEIEVTLNKVIDGTPPLYLMCMGGSTGIAGANDKELVELANNRVDFSLGIYRDNQSFATGTSTATVECTGMYLSSVSYTIPVDGNATEDVTLVGNNKKWLATKMETAFTSNIENGQQKPQTAPYIARRYAYNKSLSLVPTGSKGGIPGPETGPRINSISISADLGREAINELGSNSPYFRYVSFPVEVTSEFEIIGEEGDGVDAQEFAINNCGSFERNLEDKIVKVVICGSGVNDKLTIDLGNKNKLTSVNYSGGDAGGDNVSISYSYQTFNKLVVKGEGSFVSPNMITVSQ